MRKFKLSYLALALGLLGGAAQADDFGCQVLLCLSNPRGMLALKECEPPIERMFEEMRRLRPPPFPTCDFAGGGSNFATRDWGNGGFCPEQLASYECDNRRTCKASAVITTTFDGVATRRIWSNNDGVLLTEEPPDDSILTPNPPLIATRCHEHSTSAHE